MRRFLRFSVLFTILLVLSPAASMAQGEDLPHLERAPCPMNLPRNSVEGEHIACGYLTVPEERSDPDSRTIRLAVAALKSPSDQARPDPVLYLAGGPGASALSGVAYWLESPFLQNRDIILLEQRGTRYADPWLACPEWNEATIRNLGHVLSAEQEASREVDAAIQCRDRLVSAGVNLAAYNSAASAADVADLRHALGYEEWNLMGGSYGTRLALTVMRDYPEGIRSVVLDSVWLPNVDRIGPLHVAQAFERFFAGCAASPDCAAAYPDLEMTFHALIDQTNAEPISLTVTHSRAGRLTLQLDGNDIAAGLYQALYDWQAIPRLPALISQLQNGSYDVLTVLVETALRRFMVLSEGMNFSVQCNEEISFHGPEDVAAAGEIVPSSLRAVQIGFAPGICDIWGAGQAPPLENETVYSDIPTLVLAGSYDPITPPSYAQRASMTLSRSFYFEFPGLSHGVLSASDCPRRIAQAFLDKPGTEPDVSCISEMEAPLFVAPIAHGGDDD